MQVGGVSFHFIYSFVFTGDAIRTIHQEASGLGLRTLHGGVTGFRPYLTLRKHDSTLEPDLPPAPGARDSDTGESVDILIKGEEKPRVARISRRFHLDRSGACGYVIELALEQAPDRDKLSTKQVIDLASTAEVPCLSFPDAADVRVANQSPWSVRAVAEFRDINQLFRGDITRLARALRREQPSLDFTWLDDPDASDSVVTGQLPFVMTVLRFAEEPSYVDFLPYDGAFSLRARESVENRLRRFAALLFRWKTKNTGGWEDVDISYVTRADRAGGPVSANTHVHRDLFVASNIRSCLVACNVSPESIDGETLSTYTVPVLEGTLARTRAQWHAYLVLNASLDNDADSLRVGGELLENPQLAVRRLIERKALILKMLDSTTSHRLASDTVWTLHRHTAQLLGIRELREQALAKAELLDSLVTSARQYHALRSWLEASSEAPNTEETS